MLTFPCADIKNHTTSKEPSPSPKIRHVEHLEELHITMHFWDTIIPPTTLLEDALTDEYDTVRDVVELQLSQILYSDW